MKKNLMVALLITGVFMMALPVCAEETQTTQDAKAEVSVHETIEAFSGAEGVTVMNETDSSVKQVAVRKAFTEEWITEAADLEAFVPEAGALYDLRLETEDADSLVYLGISFDEVKEIRLFEKENAVYTVTVDMEGKEVSTEAYPIEVMEEVIPYYTTSSLNVRALPSTEGNKIYILAIAEELPVYGKTEGWYMVQYNEQYAYVSADYMTEDKELAEQKADEARAEEAARAAAAAAAQQAAYSQPQYSQPQSAPAQTQPSVYEVSRENVPSCDDPNHGTTYITYSDGSVSVVSY